MNSLKPSSNWVVAYSPRRRSAFFASKPGGQRRHARVHSSSCGRISATSKCTLVTEIRFINKGHKSDSNNNQVDSKTY